jgi:hypothetical protein
MPFARDANKRAQTLESEAKVMYGAGPFGLAVTTESVRIA